MRYKCPVSDVMMLTFIKMQVDSCSLNMLYLKKNFIVQSVLAIAYKILKMRQC